MMIHPPRTQLAPIRTAPKMCRHPLWSPFDFLPLASVGRRSPEGSLQDFFDRTGRGENISSYPMSIAADFFETIARFEILVRLRLRFEVCRRDRLKYVDRAIEDTGLNIHNLSVPFERFFYCMLLLGLFSRHRAVYDSGSLLAARSSSEDLK
jgi:hypothetical protein